jgi:hypothetical protein
MLHGAQTRDRDPSEGRKKSEKGRQLFKNEDFLKILEETGQK